MQKAKYFYKYIILLLSICMFMISCNNSSIENTKTETNLLQNAVDDVHDAEEFFNQVITDNPIDKTFEKEFQNGSKSYSELVLWYNTMWKEELHKTIDLCKDFFDDSSEIQDIFNQWEKNEKVLWDFEKENVFSDSVSMYGTQVYYEELKNIGDAYKEKTIWLKHILFIKETSLITENCSETLKSISFRSVT